MGVTAVLSFSVILLKLASETFLDYLMIIMQNEHGRTDTFTLHLVTNVYLHFDY